MAGGVSVEFSAELWLYPGNGGWHFITLPGEEADHVQALTEGIDRRGFGSVKVEATVGPCTWSTSVFPDKASGSYVLPVKKDVRQANGIGPGDRVAVTLRLVDL